MTPYYADDWLTVYQGDCREVMASMAPASVHVVCTSPPYWGLRDYGTATWIGGDADCDHLARTGRAAQNLDQLGERLGTGGGHKASSDAAGNLPFRDACGKCGAIREDGQLGLEPTPEAYVENMVAVFREIRRVLRDDGTVWLNLGDSYSGGKTGRDDAARRNGSGSFFDGEYRNGQDGSGGAGGQNRPVPQGMKPKDLVGIPWRVAFALQADGWYLRSDIIWSKPNPMPESVTDRPTKAHEYLFLLSKSPRYYFDADAVREADVTRPQRWISDGMDKREVPGQTKQSDGMAQRKAALLGAGRNLRSVWSIATQPYPGAHFATFPEKLVEPCVKAGTSERGVCSECGAPWRRRTERAVDFTSGSGRAGNPPDGKNGQEYEQATSGTYDVRMGPSIRSTTVGWDPTCEHDYLALVDGRNEGTVPAAVLDPFAGSGTTGRVAQRLGRRAVLIDLSAAYLVQAMERNQDIPLGLETA